MKKTCLAILLLLSAAAALVGSPLARSDTGAMTSADPAKADEAFQQAQNRQSQQADAHRAPRAPQQRQDGLTSPPSIRPADPGFEPSQHIGRQPGEDRPADTGFDLAHPTR